MSDYSSTDGRIRILSIARRAPWRQHQNLQGGLYTTWSAWDMRQGRWIPHAQEHPTLRSLKRRLIEEGFGDSVAVLRREK